MKQHRCLDCQTVQLSPNAKRCPSCEVKHRKEVDRRRKKENKEIIKIKRRKQRPPAPPHKCLTCETMVSGKNKYCVKCKVERQKHADLKYRDFSQLMQDNYICPTSNDYLKKFIKFGEVTKQTGLSYGQQNKPPVTIERK